MRRFLPYLFILFLIAIFLRVDFFFTIAYFFLAIYVFSRLWLEHLERNLLITRHFFPRAFYGDEVAVEVNVANNSWLPAPWLEVKESLPLELATPPFYQQVISLRAQESRKLHYTLLCRRRGYHTIGPLNTHTGDLLGLDNRDLIYKPQTLIVYPRIVALHQLGLPTRSPLAILKTTKPLFEDPSRVISVRDYQRGDSPRKIHWTASASARKLLVKQYHPAISRETMIALDLDYESYDRRGRYDAVEMAITAAASIANFIMVQQRLPSGIVTEARDSLTKRTERFFLPPRSERLHLSHILETLARVNITDRPAPFASLLRRESVHLSWGTTLIAISGHADEELLNALAYLKRSGFAVSLMLIKYEHIPPAIQAQADALKIDLHRVWNDLDLKQQ